MFFRIDALKNFASFTGKHLCQCLFLINLQASRQGFSSEIIFKKTFFYRTSLVTSAIFRTQFTPLRFSKTDLMATLRSCWQPFLTTRLVFNSVVKGIVLLFILLTFNIFHIFFQYFFCQFRAGKYRLGTVTNTIRSILFS